MSFTNSIYSKGWLMLTLLTRLDLQLITEKFPRPTKEEKIRREKIIIIVNFGFLISYCFTLCCRPCTRIITLLSKIVIVLMRRETSVQKQKWLKIKYCAWQYHLITYILITCKGKQVTNFISLCSCLT